MDYLRASEYLKKPRRPAGGQPAVAEIGQRTAGRRDRAGRDAANPEDMPQMQAKLSDNVSGTSPGATGAAGACVNKRPTPRRNTSTLPVEGRAPRGGVGGRARNLQAWRSARPVAQATLVGFRWRLVVAVNGFDGVDAPPDGIATLP